MRPPFSTPGRECVAPGGREAPGEPFRWGSPGSLRDDTKRGDTRVPPLWNHPPWGTGSGNSPATAKRPCPPPFCERGASPSSTSLSVERCQSTPNNQGAAAKRGAGSIRTGPQLPQLPYAVEWMQALKSAPNSSRKRRKKAFQAGPEMPPPKRLFLPPSATHSFSQEEKEWGAQSCRAFPAPPS